MPAPKLERIRGLRRRKVMTKQLSATVTVCSEYQRFARRIGKGQRSVGQSPVRGPLGSADSEEDNPRAASIAGEVRASVHAVAEALLRAMRAPAENCIVQTNERQILYRGPATFSRKVCLHYVVKGGTNVHLWPSGMRLLSSANRIR